MKQFLINNKKPIATILVVALVVYLIYCYGKSKGGFTPVPTDGGTGISQADAQHVRETSLRIKQDIYGVNVWSRDTEVYYTLSEMSDTLFVAVCNDYRTLTGKSLRDDMNGEYYTYSSIALSGVIDSIKGRMSRLNIQ